MPLVPPPRETRRDEKALTIDIATQLGSSGAGPFCLQAGGSILLHRDNLVSQRQFHGSHPLQAHPIELNARCVFHERRERAKARSVKMGRKPKLTPHQIREAIKRRDTDEEPLREIARTYNVSHSTISRLAT